MPNNLALFPFTNLSNTAVSSDGWYVETGIAVDALAGKDTISGTKNGIINFGRIDTGAGNDKITGNSPVDGINNHGTINTGEGDDTVTGTTTGTWKDGIWNFGMILTGAGNDRITGISSTRNNMYESSGIDNYGVIFTGTGDDTITGKSSSEYGSGIMNERTIDTGDGNDRITGIVYGRGRDQYSKDRRFGIENYGIIDTGAGNDIIDALRGGFGSGGTTDLGSGQDTLKGFGTGTFNGGAGIDKILFGQGTYTVTGSTIVSDGVTMNANQFEKMGGANGGLFAFKNGTLTVDAAGVGTFA